MLYVGIDYHKRYSVLTVLQHNGQIIDQRRLNHSEPTLFKQYLMRFKKPLAVVYESSVNWPWLYELLEPLSCVKHITLANPYKVRLSIDDGTGAPLRNFTRAVMVIENTAPFFAPNLGPYLQTDLDPETFTASLNMSVTCWDDENDNLTLAWDFGDGTEPIVQWTGPALMGVECTQNHTWSPDPELWYGLGDTEIVYHLNLSLTDGVGHWTNTTTMVEILLGHNFSPHGNISVLAFKVDPTDVVIIYGNASDPEGEPLTWTFVFSNATEVIHTDVYHTGLTEPGAKVFQNTSYVFSVPGNHTVTLYLSDLALPELQVDPDHAAHNVSVGAVCLLSVNNSIPYVSAEIDVVDCDTGSQDIVVNATTGVALARNQGLPKGW